ncbi:hypothetical protein [Acinetobacter gandensis]|uniref:hypothetical protein n=2 Tax=Acinetobacter TaxID=469 RepID=UPI003989B3DA
MPITAYSKTFKRELQVSQLEDLHSQFVEQLKLNPDFRLFVKDDVECPCCNISNGIVVREGVSSKNNKVVKQAHFSFRNNEDQDAHLKFCDYYNGVDKLKTYTNNCIVEFKDSDLATTEIIRHLICAAIENDIICQSDIRDMRNWFLNIRSKKDIYLEDSSIILNTLHQMTLNEHFSKSRYIPVYAYEADPNFKLELEVYRSLSHNLEKDLLPERESQIYTLLKLKTFINKAITISKKDHGLYSFDRTLLEPEYKKTIHVSYKIILSIPELSKKYGRSILEKARKNNAFMAYSALLLFTSNWDINEALLKHEKIYNIKDINDLNLGNTIGINPFLDYLSWTLLKYIHELRVKNKINNVNHLYENEKNKLKTLTYPFL